MLGILLAFQHILLGVLFISRGNCAENLVGTCKTDEGHTISAWNWEVRNSKNEKYFINICGLKANTLCGQQKDVSVCKKSDAKLSNYGARAGDVNKIPTLPYGRKGFSITFNGSVPTKTGCEHKNIQTKINFQCHTKLGSPELVDDTGCIVVIDFFTKEACAPNTGDDKIAEIPCVIYNNVDQKKRDLSPLTKTKGGHLVSSETHGVDIYINVCRDIKFGPEIPDNSCSDKGKTSPACRKDINKPIGKITSDSKLYYEGDSIKLVYSYTGTAATKKQCPKGVYTNITFMCQKQFSDGGTGPVLITPVNAKIPLCEYNIIWRTGHACANNDVITTECQFSNGEVSFDLTKLEKRNKQLSYGVTEGDYEYRIKVCHNGQACGSDIDGTHTAVCQRKGDVAYSCGSAQDRTIRYADGILTMVYKSDTSVVKPCSNNLPRRTIITFRCDPSAGVGAPTFVEEEHCYYYFNWNTQYVCPSRKPGDCSIISDGNTFDLSILTKSNTSWLAVNGRKEAKGYTYYINVCASLNGDESLLKKYPKCRESAVCEIDPDGNERGIGMYKTAPVKLKESGLSLTYSGGRCPQYTENVTTTIKFVCKSTDLESPPALESRSWDDCSYVFTWHTAAACSLQVISGEGCILEDLAVTGNVFDLSPLGMPGEDDKDYFAVKGKNSDVYTIKICSNKGVDCGHGSNKKESVGICQTSGKKYYVVGKLHDNLYYYDGVLTLQFTKGDLCTSQKKQPRKAYITFFCDESVGRGKPVFVGETQHCLYNFVWHTKHACPLKTMQCVVKDSNGNEYDLSPLVKSPGNWKVTEDKSTYYINICRVLHRNDEVSDCPAASSVCMKLENGTAISIGQIVGALTINNGLPVLQYQNNRYRTIITFTCDHQGQVGEPLLDTSGGGVYSFVWTTKEACRVKPKKESGCDDKDTRLSMLKTKNKQGYKIGGPNGGHIIFDICQDISCGKGKTSAACLIDSKGGAKSIGRSAKSSLEHSQDVTTLTYPGGDWFDSGKSFAGYYTTKINFLCAPNVSVESSAPTFITQEVDLFVIEFRTSAVCKFVDVECVTRSTLDEYYDLKPLSLSSGNWMAEDTRSHLDYYINVCRGYFPGDAKAQCQGTAGIGGCQVDNKAVKAYNMGYVVNAPTVSSRGHVTLRYINGDICHKTYRRSTRINFFCSDVHGSPVHLIETEVCEYVFNWKTPSACPVVEYNGQADKSCGVYDATYGFYYDLTPLKGAHSQDIADNMKYLVGFCAFKPEECAKDDDSCLIKDKSATAHFKFQSLTYHDGKIIFNHTNSTFNMLNKISCDPAVEILSPVGRLKEDNGYNILWTSKLACPPVSGEECTITHQGNLYDLTVLAKEKWNWLARNTIEEFGFKDYQFHFSVCKPLKGISDPKRKGSRGIIKDKDGKLTSLGTMIEPLKISDGYLIMKYGRGGEINGCQKTTTILQFVCDNITPGGVGVGPVVDGFDRKTCEFHVTWLTRAACPVRSLLGNPYAPCTAIHPATKKLIDLGALSKTDGAWQVKDQHGNDYIINVCGQAKGCPVKSGICKTTKDGQKSKSVGSFSKALVYRQGFLYLHYKNGDKCEKKPEQKTETLISFICDPYAKSETKPTLELTNDCTHFVTWKTSLACEAEVDCVAHDGKNFYDLTPLIRNDGNYEVEGFGKVYRINVCRSLVNESRCPANAAVCAEGKSFGSVSSPPTIVHQQPTPDDPAKVKLIYTSDKCNTTIDFKCDPTDRKKPIITLIDGKCLVVSWWTSLVCDKPESSKNNNNCTFNNPDQQFCFDLRKLHEKKSSSIPDGNVHFHLCGKPSSSDCQEKEQGEVCLKQNNKNVTALTRKSIRYEGQEVRISYGDDEVEVILYCGENGASSPPQFIGRHKTKDADNEEITKYVFNMVTPLVCPAVKLACEVTYGKKTFNLAGLSRRVGQERDGENVYFYSICGHVPFTPETKICSSRATLVKVSQKEPQVMAVDTGYSLAYHENKDYPIQLEYSGNEISDHCDNSKKSYAKVIHQFKCKNVALRLVRFKRKDCLFTFLWETIEACDEKRVPLKQTGNGWTFYDETRPGCELDLTSLQNELVKWSKKNKGCRLENNVTVKMFEEEYELMVLCVFSSTPSTGKAKLIDVIIRCSKNESKLTETSGDNFETKSFLWTSSSVCLKDSNAGCSQSYPHSVASTTLAVIGTLMGIGLLAAILFFVCKPEKRETTALWLRWHVRKYICCKPSYQASYRYKKVKTDEEDGETDFIIEAGAGSSLFSDDSDDDNQDDSHDSDDTEDDDLLPLDDDLLNLEE